MIIDNNCCNVCSKSLGGDDCLYHENADREFYYCRECLNSEMLIFWYIRWAKEIQKNSENTFTYYIDTLTRNFVGWNRSLLTVEEIDNFVNRIKQKVPQNL